MANYQLKISQNGIILGELTNANHITYGHKLNYIKEASFEIPLSIWASDNSQTSMITDDCELLIYRENKLIWSGIKPIIEDTISSSQRVVQYTFVQKPYALSSRYYNGTFTGVEEAQIAWSMINATQIDTISGNYTASQVDLGFRQGFLGNNVTRQRTYSNQEILSALVNLTNVINGGNFSFSPTIRKNTKDQFFWASQIGQYTDVKFSFEDNSIKQASRKIDTRNIYNYVTGIGTGITSSSYDTNQSRLDKYKMGQTTFSDSNLSIQATLQQNTDQIIINKQQPLITYDFQLFDQGQFGNFDVGDWVRFRVTLDDTGGRFAVDTYLRVFEINVTVDSTGFENFSLIVGQIQPGQEQTVEGIFRNIQNKISKI